MGLPVEPQRRRFRQRAPFRRYENRADWFAADKTGFHMLHTLFQTSLKYPQIQRFDEHFVLDIIVDEGHVRGLVALNMMEGTKVQIRANSVIMARRCRSCLPL